MPRLLITRGLPASGKTTFAREWVAADPGHRARVNRDDLRSMLDDGVYVKGVTEARVLAARDATILGLLSKGLDVICDDTNLAQRVARDLARLATRSGARLEVIDLTMVSVDECVRRDATRECSVGEWVIRDTHARYLAGRALPLPWPTEPVDATSDLEPYRPAPGTPRAVLVDVDGTVALMGARSPFDETRVHEDRPNLPVIAAVRAMHAAGHRVVFASGRTDACRAATEAWLAEHVRVPYDALHMRPAGDMRKDSIVKRELFDQHVRHAYDVVAVFDDRRQVVEMWRSLGLCVLHVAEGNF